MRFGSRSPERSRANPSPSVSPRRSPITSARRSAAAEGLGPSRAPILVHPVLVRSRLRRECGFELRYHGRTGRDRVVRRDRCEEHSAGLRGVLVVMLCMAGGRTIGILREGAPNVSMWLFLAGELAVAAAASVTLRAGSPEPS